MHGWRVGPARTAWHSHANGQALHVTDGIGLAFPFFNKVEWFAGTHGDEDGIVIGGGVIAVDEEGGASGRSKADAPEIDGVVKFKGGNPGEIARVLIDRADEHDLFGRLQ